MSVRHHPDTEALNEVAEIVTRHLKPRWLQFVPFSVRYGIAGDVLHWMDENRPRARTVTREQVREAWEAARWVEVPDPNCADATWRLPLNETDSALRAMTALGVAAQEDQ